MLQLTTVITLRGKVYNWNTVRGASEDTDNVLFLNLGASPRGVSTLWKVRELMNLGICNLCIFVYMVYFSETSTLQNEDEWEKKTLRNKEVINLPKFIEIMLIKIYDSYFTCFQMRKISQNFICAYLFYLFNFDPWDHYSNKLYNFEISNMSFLL